MIPVKFRRALQPTTLFDFNWNEAPESQLGVGEYIQLNTMTEAGINAVVIKAYPTTEDRDSVRIVVAQQWSEAMPDIEIFEEARKDTYRAINPEQLGSGCFYKITGLVMLNLSKVSITYDSDFI